MRKFWKALMALTMVMIPLLSDAQVELGECDEMLYDAQIESNANKAIAAFEQKNLPMAKIYIGNILKIQEHHPHGLYLQGELLLRQGQIQKAVSSWEQLFAVCPEYRAELYFFAGVIYYETGKEDAGKEFLRKFLTMPDRDKGFDKEAKAILKEDEVLSDLIANPVPFSPQPVRQISTEADEYLAIISPDNQFCFFTRKVKTFNKYDGPGAGEKMVELFCQAVRTGQGTYTEGSPLPEPFNSQFNEGGASITADNNEMFLTICQPGKDGYNNCDLYHTKKSYGVWGPIRSLGPGINNPNTWESQVSVSPDGQTMYFASDRPGGFGGTDIYKCQRQSDGTWGAPENLGPSINTDKDEKSPFIHSDSQTLYFASNGHITIGGFDLFLSRFRDGKWEEPLNLGYPINSEKDEVGLFVSLDGRKGFFNSNKLKRIGVGGWDLFSFDMPENRRPEEVTLITGILTVDERPAMESATVSIKNLKTNEERKVQVDESTGNFAAVIKKEEKDDLILKIEKEGVAFNSRFVDAQDSGDEGVVQTEFDLSPMSVGKEYRLHDINFASNSAELDRKARAIIDEFVVFLRANPSVKVDIQGHTDNVGNPGDNQTLSYNRAKSVYHYLTSKGVAAARLQYHGYGEDRPVAPNDTPEGRAKNRRTVFVITSK
jgi:outer membrane protein OmpA-like peptidoglycan-associated protein